MARQTWGKNTRVKLVGGSLFMKMPGRRTQQMAFRATEIKARSEDLRPVFKDFGDYMLARIDDTFKAEGLPRRWKPLAPATIRDKQRQGYGNKGILERTGRLRRGFRTVVTSRTLQISNSVKVGRYNLFEIHQFGTRTIPARPVIRQTKTERDALTRFMRKHIGGE